ncbi:MAG: hypothetical protein Q8P89_00720 [bacterium]|nr:hypothetical protein [bacterium]
MSQAAWSAIMLSCFVVGLLVYILGLAISRREKTRYRGITISLIGFGIMFIGLFAWLIPKAT